MSVSTDPAHTGDNDVGVALNNAFNYIETNKKVKIKFFVVMTDWLISSWIDLT